MSRTVSTALGVLAGRILLTMAFLMAGIFHLSPEAAEYAAMSGVPLASVLVPASGLLAMAGGLSVLLGYRARIGALLIAAFLVPVTLTMHAFWTIADPIEAGMQQGMFLKNASMLGAALLVIYFGSGPLSLDAWLRGRRGTQVSVQVRQS